jgi:hypothetical protein
MTDFKNSLLLKNKLVAEILEDHSKDYYEFGTSMFREKGEKR